VARLCAPPGGAPVCLRRPRPRRPCPSTTHLRFALRAEPWRGRGPLAAQRSRTGAKTPPVRPPGGAGRPLVPRGLAPRSRRQCSAVPPHRPRPGTRPPGVAPAVGGSHSVPGRPPHRPPHRQRRRVRAFRLVLRGPTPRSPAARPRGRAPLAGGCPSFLFWSGGSVMVGFTGSRSLPSQFAPLVGSVVAAVSGPVAVGCAAGADALVRSAAGARAQVFHASAFAQPGAPRAAALVARSVALVRAVAASPSPALVGFVSSACPAGLSPSASPSACFSGSGSGTWATLALAAGLGLPVFASLCGVSASALPSWWAGSWQPVSSGPFAGAWQFVPAQLALF
jgi:hypothetical protein